MWLPKLGHTRHHRFFLTLAVGLLALGKVSHHVATASSDPLKRSSWWGTEDPVNSCVSEPPWEQILQGVHTWMGKVTGKCDSVGEKGDDYSISVLGKWDEVGLGHPWKGRPQEHRQTTYSHRRVGRAHRRGCRAGGRRGSASVWKLSSECICFLRDKRKQSHQLRWRKEEEVLGFGEKGKGVE